MGSALSAAAGVGVVIAVTRALPKDAAGTFFSLTSLFLIAEVITRLGTGTGLVYVISRARALGHQPGRIAGYLRVALTPVIALSVLVALGMFLAAPEVAHLAVGRHDSDTVGAVRALAVLLPLTTVSDTLVSATRGFGTMLPTVVVDRVGRPVLQLAAVVMAATAGSAAVLSTAWAAPWVLSALVAGWWLWRLYRNSVAAAGPSARHGAGREFWSFTAPRAVASVVQLTLQRLDIVLLALLVGPAEAAVYTAATRFLVVGQFANQALSTVVEPRLGSLFALADRTAAKDVYRTATGWLILVCWPFYLLVMNYSGQLLRVFGSGYMVGVPVTVILAAAMLLATAVGMVDVVLIMGGRTRWNLGNASAALVVNVVIDLLLIPRLGMLGAAIGWATAILVNNIAPLLQIWRSSGLHPFGAGPAVAAVLSVACFGVLPAVTRTTFGNGTAALVATTALGTVAWLLGCWRWRRLLVLDGLPRGRRSSSRLRGDSPHGSAASLG